MSNKTVWQSVVHVPSGADVLLSVVYYGSVWLVLMMILSRIIITKDDPTGVLLQPQPAGHQTCPLSVLRHQQHTQEVAEEGRHHTLQDPIPIYWKRPIPTLQPPPTTTSPPFLPCSLPLPLNTQLQLPNATTLLTPTLLTHVTANPIS